MGPEKLDIFCELTEKLPDFFSVILHMNFLKRFSYSTIHICIMKNLRHTAETAVIFLY